MNTVPLFCLCIFEAKSVEFFCTNRKKYYIIVNCEEEIVNIYFLEMATDRRRGMLFSSFQSVCCMGADWNLAWGKLDVPVMGAFVLCGIVDREVDSQ